MKTRLYIPAGGGVIAAVLLLAFLLFERNEPRHAVRPAPVFVAEVRLGSIEEKSIRLAQ